VRTYATMLQSSGDIKIESLVQAHLGMGSVLHPLASQPESDMGALIYAVRRLPEAISRCRNVVMGQSPQGFRAVLRADILSWQAVKAPARRRRWYHDGKNTLAVLIASASDIDDLVPTLVAYQIEWNKLHRALREVGVDPERVREEVKASRADWNRLREAWGSAFGERMRLISERRLALRVRMLGGSHTGYARQTRRWWAPVSAELALEDLTERPLYFVSSNTHSIVNIVTGIAREREPELVAFVEQMPETDILRQVGAWDPFNVTEDCDLGLRLAQEKLTTVVLDSVTMEEGNSNLRNWIRQRSRWIKGYLQTYLVHMRRPWRYLRRGMYREFVSLQFIIGGTPATLTQPCRLHRDQRRSGDLRVAHSPATDPTQSGTACRGPRHTACHPTPRIL